MHFDSLVPQVYVVLLTVPYQEAHDVNINMSYYWQCLPWLSS